MHPRDLDLLHNTCAFFGVGSVKVAGNHAYYTVTGLANLAVIINHFTLYPLFTSKSLAFQIWSKVISLQSNSVHRTLPGFLYMVGLINVLNTPINPDKFKAISALGTVPTLSITELTIPVVRTWVPTVWWIVGFFCGEGSFTYSASTKSGATYTRHTNVSWYAEVSQAIMDLYVLQAILLCLGVGKIYSESRGLSRIRITALTDLVSVVLPLFDNHPIPGFKGAQYAIWREGVQLNSVTYAKQSWSQERETAQLAVISRLRAIRKTAKT